MRYETLMQVCKNMQLINMSIQILYKNMQLHINLVSNELLSSKRTRFVCFPNNRIGARLTRVRYLIQ